MSFPFIKLFYAYFKANFELYYGHSSNVTNLKFLADNTHLISTGGDDLW